jgi:hypothetical protein
MSDTMLYGILRMPIDMAMSGEFSRVQFYQAVQECATRLEKAEAELAALQHPAWCPHYSLPIVGEHGCPDCQAEKP